MQNAFASSGGFCAGSVEVVAHQRINSPTYVFSAALPPLLAVSASEAISLLSTPLSSTDPQHPLATLPTNVRALRQILDQVATIEIPSAEMSPLIHVHIKPSVLEKPLAEGGRPAGRQRSHSHVSHPQPSPIVVPAAGMSPATSSSNRTTLSSHGRGGGGGGGALTTDASTAVTTIESSRQEQERLLQEIVDLCGENGVLLTTTKRTWAQELTEVRPSIRICVSSALTKKEIDKAGAVVKNAINKVLGKKK